ncbi:MAG TPA: DUF6709 family protein, partial [Planctomycetota bacterium]|nr:DUF6709 family protein [Planctomycetota bacterium]
VLFSIGARNFLKYVERGNDVSKHPVALALSKYGEPAEVADRIEQELRSEKLQVGKVILTPRWILCPFAFHVAIRKVEDLAWIYKKVTTHKKYGVTTGHTYETMLRDRDGGEVTTQGKEADVNRLLLEVQKRAPWVIAGYDDQIQAMWTKNRAGLIAAVDAKRKELSAT